MNSCCMMDFNNKSSNIPQPSEKPYLAIFSEAITPILKEQEEALNVEINFSYIGRNEYKVPSLGKEDENPEKEVIIGCTLKSKYDNFGNRNAPIDILVAFDISGSMTEQLDNTTETNKLTRADLAKKCLILLKSKLGPKDRIGLLTFNNAAFQIFDIDPLDDIKNFDSKVGEIQIQGGTTISSCINLAIDMFEVADKKIKSKSKDKQDLRRFKRLILLTDMNNTGTDDDLIEGIQN